uniref:Cytochrome b561 domain-containing protein n=1 Tax=Rhabditophanes sp. KR3021 TaxID=114890 RepID=A0AC35TYN1_9BILA
MARKNSFLADDLSDVYDIQPQSQSARQNYGNKSTVTYTADESTLEYDTVECTPNMCLNPYAILRMGELFVLAAIHWLVQITCGNEDCTMILNEFGDKAHLQGLVLAIDLLLGVVAALILCGYGLNMHKSRPDIILGVEKIHGIVGFILLLICGILGSIYAAQTTDPEINRLGRSNAGIRPQWIAAACLEFLLAFVYLGDFLGQRREGFPFSYSSNTTTNNWAREEARRKQLIKEHRLREENY